MLWEKPNGNTIELNDLPETEEFALSLGWKKKVKKRKSAKKVAKDDGESRDSNNGCAEGDKSPGG